MDVRFSQEGSPDTKIAKEKRNVLSMGICPHAIRTIEDWAQKKHSSLFGTTMKTDQKWNSRP